MTRNVPASGILAGRAVGGVHGGRLCILHWYGGEGGSYRAIASYRKDYQKYAHSVVSLSYEMRSSLLFN